MSTAVAASPQPVHKPSVALAILLIVLGALALALPMLASFGVIRVLAWLLLFDGIAQFVYAFRSEGVGRTLWKLLVAVLYLVAGFYLLTHPLLGLASLTFFLAVFFFVEGFMDVATWLFARGDRGSAWLLLHGIITLILGVMIWRHWPMSSFFVFGTFIGISMILTGTTRLMMAMEARKQAKGSQP